MMANDRSLTHEEGAASDAPDADDWLKGPRMTLEQVSLNVRLPEVMISVIKISAPSSRSRI
jgi:hypothetical protein